MEKSDLIFAITCEPSDGSFGHGVVIYFNTRECWSNRHCLTDGYTEEEEKLLEPVLKKHRLLNLSESTYEPARRVTREELHKALLAEVGFDPEFQSWMESEVMR